MSEAIRADTTGKAVLSLHGVRKRYYLGSLLGRRRIDALDDVHLEVAEDKPTVISIVGESGSGKTTLAKVILGLIRPDSGTVSVCGYPVAGPGRRLSDRDLIRLVQPIFQNPFDAFSGYRRLDAYLRDTAVFVRRLRDADEINGVLEEVLGTVGLRLADIRGKYQSQFSGGELQRISIARALIAHPRLIVADEPASMIDASLRMNVVNLFRKVKEERRTHFLYITHDLATAYYLSDYIAIMYRGCIMELGTAQQVLDRPSHPYTQLLLASVPSLDTRWEGSGEKLPDIESEEYALVGCPFSRRCPRATEVCTRVRPGATSLGPARTVYCHHAQT
jgi:peptide/nickel transport system ATP-binding protein